MRDIRPWIFLGLGLFLAGLTGLALYGIAAESAQQRAPAQVETRQIIVARGDIKARVVLAPGMLDAKTFPADLVPNGAVANAADVIGQTTLAAIPNGAAILQSQLASGKGKGGGASATLPWGKVLVAFPTSDPLTAAGLIKPGDHVDILATITSGNGESARKTQQTVQNLEVIDVLNSGQDVVTGREVRPSALVFQVDHQIALVLKYLRDAQATIDVVVRSQDETENASAVSVDLGYLMQTYGIRK